MAKDASAHIDKAIHTNNAAEHSQEYIQELAFSLQEIFQKIQKSCEDYFEKMSELDQERQSDLQQFQMERLNKVKDYLQSFNDIYNERCTLQEEARSSLSSVQAFRDQLILSEECWRDCPQGQQQQQ